MASQALELIANSYAPRFREPADVFQRLNRLETNIEMMFNLGGGDDELHRAAMRLDDELSIAKRNLAASDMVGVVASLNKMRNQVILDPKLKSRKSLNDDITAAISTAMDNTTGKERSIIESEGPDYLEPTQGKTLVESYLESIHGERDGFAEAAFDFSKKPKSILEHLQYAEAAMKVLREAWRRRDLKDIETGTRLITGNMREINEWARSRM